MSCCVLENVKLEILFVLHDMLKCMMLPPAAQV